MAAAAWSCVEKMLHEAQRSSAPSARSVSISTAVWIVMCSEPAIRAPLSGWLGPYSVRSAISPGISVSAIAISLRPQSASEMSLTTWSGAMGASLREEKRACLRRNTHEPDLAIAARLKQGRAAW